MKTLLLLRHAKSSWDDPDLSDFARPLAPRGEKAAPLIAKYMAQKCPAPGLVLCSGARRTVQTWELVSGRLGADLPVKFQRGLYLAPPSRLLAAIRRVPDDVDCLLMIGHNPGTEHLAARLSGPASDDKAFVRMMEKFPTAALAQIEFDLPAWPAVGDGTGRLRRFVRPRDL